MSEPIVVSVKNVSKNFKLPHEKVTSVKSLFVNMFRRNRTVEVQHALKDISFDIKQGEFFGIVGRNGSGKSTLLKIIAGIYQPTKGQIQINGKLVPFIELGVGFNPELTGRENVYLNGALLGFSESEIDGMYDDIVAFAELEKFMDQKLKNYSSGMQVRLAFSVATRAKSDILLIDEVLAVGDADFQRKCFNYFKELKKSGVTVIFVTHDMDAVRQYCDRAMLIDKNVMKTTGTPEQVSTQYTKLFAVQETKVNKEVNTSDKWGDGLLRYEGVTVPGVVNDSTSNIIIKATLMAKEQSKRPVLGFSIKDATGKAITGTNTKIMRQKEINIEKGEKVTVSWSIPNIFSNGKHTVDLAVTAEDGIRMHEWWEGAASFTVDKERGSPYIITPAIEVEIDK